MLMKNNVCTYIGICFIRSNVPREYKCLENVHYEEFHRLILSYSCEKCFDLDE
jgi:hypothetical protein